MGGGGTFSDIVGFVVGLMVFGVPFWKMYGKAGVNKAWVTLLLVPVVGYFGLWLVLAVSKWPNAATGGDNGNA